MHELTFLHDLAVVMMVAGLVTVLFHRFKQPVVLGYILAGLIIGPHTPPSPLIHSEETIRTLAELGVILLMFSLGLEFSLRKLRQVGGTAFVAAFLEIVLMVWAGYVIGRAFGWTAMDSIFLGAMLSVSSTTIIIKALAELGKAKEKFAELIFGILIIEDMLAIVMIALLSGIAMTGTLSVVEVGSTIGRLGIFLVATLVIGLLAVPRLIGYVARFKSNEMLLVTVLALCFGFALLAAKLEYSVALGAFLIGAVIAEAREIGKVEHLTEPVRDMFSAIFFVAIGLMIDPKMLAAYWLPILVIAAAVVIGKIVSCSFGAFVGGNDTRTSLQAGMGLAQIGEFSFIIASLGLTLKVTSEFLYPIAVAVSAITTLLTPYLIRNTDGLLRWFDRTAPAALVNSLELYTRWVAQRASHRQSSPARTFVRRWFWQMVLNVALVAGIFIAAAFVARQPPAWLKNLRLGPETLKSTLWLVATVAALPLLIATYRKMEALGLLVAEIKTSSSTGADGSVASRRLVARVIPFSGLVALGIYILLLSAALLPSPKVLVGLVLVVALITWLLWRSFVKVYARAQYALQATLSQPPPQRDLHSQQPPQGLLNEANLDKIAIHAASAATGKLIRELQLRTLTGASVVGIQRQTTNIVNPGPDEEIREGDQLLILGTPEQLVAARKVLAPSS